MIDKCYFPMNAGFSMNVNNLRAAEKSADFDSTIYAQCIRAACWELVTFQGGLMSASDLCFIET